MRSLAANLIIREKIQTTKVRARQTANFVEKMITKAKSNDLSSRRSLLAILPKEAANKLISTIAPRFKDRKGGYTRVVKLGERIKDGAPMAVVELIDRPATEAVVAGKKAKTDKKNKKESKKEKKEETKAEA